MDRRDLLEGRPSRANLFRGRILADESDDVLQALVARAAQAAGTPIALVSLILDNIQLFRAQVGLPPDLAAARGTDRDVSFCQFVVANEVPLRVEQAPNDQRVPQALVERYGIQAYLGVPIHVDGEIVGTLCVIDSQARRFTDDEARALEALAREVDERLAALSAVPLPPVDIRVVSAGPGFGELRNRLQAVAAEAGLARMRLAEFGPMYRVLLSFVQSEGAAGEPEDLHALLDVLRSSRRAFAEVDEHLERVEQNLVSATQTMEAAQELVAPGFGPRTLGNVIDRALRLAHHTTKLVGGVEVENPSSELDRAAPDTLTVATVAAPLSTLATVINAAGRRGGIRLGVESGSDGDAPEAGAAPVRIRLVAPELSPSQRDELEVELRCLTGFDAGVEVTAREDGLEITAR